MNIYQSSKNPPYRLVDIKTSANKHAWGNTKSDLNLENAVAIVKQGDETTEVPIGNMLEMHFKRRQVSNEVLLKIIKETAPSEVDLKFFPASGLATICPEYKGPWIDRIKKELRKIEHSRSVKRKRSNLFARSFAH